MAYFPILATMNMSVNVKIVQERTLDFEQLYQTIREAKKESTRDIDRVISFEMADDPAMIG